MCLLLTSSCGARTQLSAAAPDRSRQCWKLVDAYKDVELGGEGALPGARLQAMLLIALLFAEAKARSLPRHFLRSETQLVSSLPERACGRRRRAPVTACVTPGRRLRL